MPVRPVGDGVCRSGDATRDGRWTGTLRPRGHPTALPSGVAVAAHPFLRLDGDRVAPAFGQLSGSRRWPPVDGRLLPGVIKSGWLGPGGPDSRVGCDRGQFLAYSHVSAGSPQNDSIQSRFSVVP